MLGSLGRSFVGSAFRPKRSLRAFARMSPAGRFGMSSTLLGRLAARRLGSRERDEEEISPTFTGISRFHAQQLFNRRARMREEKARRRAARAEKARNQKRARDRRTKMARK